MLMGLQYERSMVNLDLWNLFIAQKNIHFSENQINIEIQNFEAQKVDQAYACVKISEYPPGTLHFIVF